MRTSLDWALQTLWIALEVFLNAHVKQTVGVPAECNSYIDLDEPGRYWSNNSGSLICDEYDPKIVSNQWYRFTGGAGRMMAPYCIPQSSCSTHRSSWINGDHPTSLYATVTTTVCMHWSSDCCERSYPVGITQCDGYYVYKLQKPTACYERYCGVLDANDACFGTAGSAVCACNPGYSGNPCSDVDECTAGTHDCHASATCTNTVGSFTCSCNPGYTGDGKTCSNANPACTGYAQLSTADRHVSSYNISIALCDHGIVTQWYRFTGSAGTSMPESCPAELQCTTHAPGWLNGIHPTVAEGEVTRTVCYHYSGSCCYWSNSIKVLNCGGFYVYELKPTPGCSLRYCGTNVAPSTEPPPECLSQGYTILNEANRYWNNEDGGPYCDRDPGNIVSNQWYRFEGAAGVRMASHCIPQQSCNTNNAGWVNGAHPNVKYERAFRDVCIHSGESCCNLSYPTEIRNCSGFYVYKLQQPNGCAQRYCGVNGDNDACVASPGSPTCGCLVGYTGIPCTDIDECLDNSHNCHLSANCTNNAGSFSCSCLIGYTGDGISCSDIDECTAENHDCHAKAVCSNIQGSFSCNCIQGYTGDGKQCADTDECAEGTHDCHGVAHCYNDEASFTCQCRSGYTGDGLTCSPLGDFSVTIANISKDSNKPTAVKRSATSIQTAVIKGLPAGAKVLDSVLEWRLISEAELAAAESAEGELVSEGTAEWAIDRRSLSAGKYQVKFDASITIGDSTFPQTIQAFDYGFIEIMSGPLRVVVDGGSSVRWGSNETVTVDGSLSYDEDVGPGSHSGLNFTWSCGAQGQNASMSYECFGAFSQRGDLNITSVTIDTSVLEVGQSYILQLTLWKDVRSSSAEMIFEISSGDVPRVILRCFVDCGAIVSSSNKFRVTSECSNSACVGASYEWILERFDTESWETVSNVADITATPINSSNIIIEQNMLLSNTQYRLKLSVISLMKVEGHGLLEFETAGEPHGGFCKSLVTEGVSLETGFIFECIDWTDESTPLTYEFRNGDDPISYGISPVSPKTVLRAGDPENNYEITINVFIKNAVGVKVVYSFDIKVTPSSKLDPCQSSLEQVSSELEKLLLGPENEVDEFLLKGEISQAAQLSLSVLASAKEKTECGQNVPVDIQHQIMCAIITRFTAIPPESLQMSLLFGSVVKAATDDSQLKCDGFDVLESTRKLTSFIGLLLASSLADVEEPFSDEIQDAAATTTELLGNVLKSASSTDNTGVGGNVSQSKADAKDALQQINDIVDSISSRLVTSERLDIKKNDLSISLRKVDSDHLDGLSLEEGLTQFAFPSNLNLSADGEVNAKMMTFNFNPFPGDSSGAAITSSVCSLELSSSGNGTLNVSDLDEDIEIDIPLNPSNGESAEPTGSFLTPNKLTIHSYLAELANVPVSLFLVGQDQDAIVEVLIKYGSRPSLDEFDENFTVPLTSCQSNAFAINENQTGCAFQLQTTITVTPPEQTLIYVGILTFGEKNVTEHSRKRRSCFGGRRQKRSCIGVKDPPLEGFNMSVIPKYDPLTDVNYTLTMSQANCLYWSTTMEKWTSDGCKVGPGSDKKKLKCLCNHLTAFGGSFIQAPNPIDFDKVFVEFTRLGETGNVAVLITICAVFLLYFVVIVFARRADKRDENKITPPRAVVVNEGGSYVYEMVIRTGVWRDSGSTANISLYIDGKMDESKEINLRRGGENPELFSRGGVDGFVLITSNTYGPLKAITLYHDNSGNDPSWFPETLIIKDKQTGEVWNFLVNRWLAVEKGDGQIQVTVPCSNTSDFGFTDQVRSMAPRILADSHIWLSVVGKASSSTFTRVQRASCCLSVLFTAMIANVMFYNIGGESVAAIRVGPFKFSWQQIVIGIQSGVIVAPANILIVLLFRSSRQRQRRDDNYKTGTDSFHIVEEARKSRFTLPHCFIYIGWFLCITSTVTSAAFTLFYSLMWGKELAEQWLASIMTSLAEDIFAAQPMKVLLVACVISLLTIRRKKGYDAPVRDADTYGPMSDSEFAEDDPKIKLRRYELLKMRENKKKDVKLLGMMKQIILHTLLVFLMAITCYGNKNNNRFLMTTAVKQPFLKFDKVTHPDVLWGWMDQFFIRNLYAGFWYNNQKEIMEVFIHNKKSILLGMPRMRQVRIKKSTCGVLSFINPHCYYDYTFESEDKTLMSLPGWKELPVNTTWPDSLKMCPRPWRYQSPEHLGNASPTWGTFKLYSGGGYIAAMGYNEETAGGVVDELHAEGWIDQQTRLVVIEFTVFNINTNLVSIASFFYEVLATGAAYTTKKVETLELYSTESGAREFYLICQFLFMSMTLYYFVLLLVNLFRQRISFFKSIWNLVEFLQVVSSVTTVTFYMLKAKSMLRSVKAIQSNPYAIINFHTSLSWAEWENASIAIAVFMATLKFLNLLRVNPHVIFLFSSFRQSVGHQLSFMCILLLIFNSFAMSGILIFGGSMYVYSSYLRATVGQLEFLLGKAVPVEGLRAEHRIIGPIFALCYVLTLTIFLMNMFISMLNDAYSGAKTNVEDSTEDIELSHHLEERLLELLGERKEGRDLTKLFCDEATFVNMFSSEAEPFCKNTERILQCTYERSMKVDQRIAKLIRMTKTEENGQLEEDRELITLISKIIFIPQTCETQAQVAFMY